VLRTRRFLLQPTAGQRSALTRLLDAQRELYNAALEERRGAWLWERRRVTRFEQFRGLTGWDHPVLEFGVVPARGTLTRLDRAFAAFFRRCGRGERPGFPRFRGQNRWDSVEYGDTACWSYNEEADRIAFKGVGHVKFRRHRRPISGIAKTCLLRREGRRWWAYIVFEVAKPDPLPATGRFVGIDLGVESLMTASDGTHVANPRFLRKSRAKLAKAERLVTGRRRGSKRRRKAVEAVARSHRKIREQRRDLHHKTSRWLVANFDVIAHEKLQIRNMVRRPAPRPSGTGGFEPNGAVAKAALNREIHSAGWGSLLRLIAYKAEEAGRQVIAVDPRHTSQTCHQCGHVCSDNRVGTTVICRACGNTDDADVNAAKNILRAGLALRREREASMTSHAAGP